MKSQRIRITFARGDETKYITHLDLMRFWERALRRAAIPIAYSEGFSPHAQISLAAPLAVGTTGDAELMDVWLAEPMPPRALTRAVSPQLPPGLSIVSAVEVGLALPALQAEVRFAEYLVTVLLGTGAGSSREMMEAGSSKLEAGTAVDPASSIQPPASRPITAGTPEEAKAAVEVFLAADTIPWQHKREDETRSYDIRAQVIGLEVVAASDAEVTLRMRLKNDSSGSGRPEQVVAALGLPAPSRIHRTRLLLAGASPSREAWRKHGRFAS